MLVNIVFNLKKGSLYTALFFSIILHMMAMPFIGSLFRLDMLTAHSDYSDNMVTLYMKNSYIQKVSNQINVNKTTYGDDKTKAATKERMKPFMPIVEDVSRFILPNDVDQLPVPSSEPDFDSLDGISRTGFPVDVRIFIDHYGKVYHVQVLKALDEDIPFANKIVDMLLETGFVPARKSGVDVGTYIDREFYFQPNS
ncbi:hypothetical protein [Andreprevotia chitinilytica]|uniref:hypothetical protein n=1 Tax=Andreprevotia chitinilytica TaxID=396808 RepID=UPI000550369B|nr:hypothetical protein [Andreprevotia chitinilytica]